MTMLTLVIMAWLFVTAAPAIAIVVLLKSRQLPSQFDWIALWVSFFWMMGSLMSWLWFPDDGDFVPAAPNGVGNLLFFFSWILLGYPSIPFAMATFAFLRKSKRLSDEMKVVSLTMAIILLLVFGFTFSHLSIGFWMLVGVPSTILYMIIAYTIPMPTVATASLPVSENLEKTVNSQTTN